ncbi:patatin-like phospholipase family protein [Pontibacter ruber]|uniref:Patatin-like phospholipase family protein n=1 Tax=Pontibacter ruber TaxID=1343895 RepID=A0ABW5CTI9_9BACT|nr:patatin-like phospholipase family protein [Pontibacter ruber]
MQVGLALSGGAARGIAHLGVLKAFEQLSIKVCMISGVSSGAIAGIFYAAGYSPEEILKLIKELKVTNIARPAFRRMGLMHLDEVEKLYNKYLGEEATFEQLNLPVTVCATEMNEGVIVYYSSGKLVRPLLASSAVPILYKPVEHEGKLLVDGGLLNNMPVEPLLGNCDFKIGVHVNPINHQATITSIRGVMERTAHLAINNNVQLRMPLCDLLLEPPELKYYRLTSFAKADEIFEIGYRYTLQMAPHLRDVIRAIEKGE